jgi:hypothetical protein
MGRGQALDCFGAPAAEKARRRQNLGAGQARGGKEDFR